ncbi:hypothetical protein CRG98_040581 [Punica granatum]|uniref:Uncharacterized protein n=1 Tax=Punica granatum TaxID=22663 RepID=A0A2I0I4S5_PUNGR|nr:hypothetical protein CRG98_040581 [Punica granatum]
MSASRAPEHLPARLTPCRAHACSCMPSRAPILARTCILCTRAPFQAFNRVTRLSNTSPTLSSYPEASMQEMIRNETRKPHGTPFGPWDLSAISKEK